jgi:hypothetical protein
MFHVQSPRTDDAGVEQLIQAKGKTAPRVMPEDLEAAIESEHYFTASQGKAGAEYVIHDANDKGPLSLLTFCVLVLRNGFNVTGESACVSPDNFDAEIGRIVARENAKQKLWPLLGYALKERLAAEAGGKKDYTHADVARVQTERSLDGMSLRFAVDMKDGKRIVGTVSDCLEMAETAQAIMAECNRLAQEESA